MLQSWYRVGSKQAAAAVLPGKSCLVSVQGKKQTNEPNVQMWLFITE